MLDLGQPDVNVCDAGDTGSYVSRERRLEDQVGRQCCLNLKLARAKRVIVSTTTMYASGAKPPQSAHSVIHSLPMHHSILSNSFRPLYT